MTTMAESGALMLEPVSRPDWLRLIRAEYREIPGLCLTSAQVQRFWNLDANTAGALLAALLDVQFLRRTPRGTYVLAA
jgi:hypothetical protein